jgi:hypothetical protein
MPAGPPRAAQHLGHGAIGWSRCRVKAGPPGPCTDALQAGSAHHHLHRLPGVAVDDPQPLQDRRRTHRSTVLHMSGPLHRRPGPVDLWRPQRRDGHPQHTAAPCSAPLRCRKPMTSPPSPGRHPAQSRMPLVHFFDGFRTSHEVQKIELIPDDVLDALIPFELMPPIASVPSAPTDPVIRGTSPEPGCVLPGQRNRQPLPQRLHPSWCNRRWMSSPNSVDAQYRLFRVPRPPQRRTGSSADGLGLRNRP